jgi:hypothetical protein
MKNQINKKIQIIEEIQNITFCRNYDRSPFTDILK